MAYGKNTYRYPNAIEVEEYHSGRYGAPGQKRMKKEKPTPEAVRKVNQRNKEKLCRRKMRKYFRKKDLYVTLTYEVPKRPPDMETAKKHFKKFTEKMRKYYRKAGIPFRWIRNIENGTRDAWHIHILMKRIPEADLVIAEAWEHGTVDVRPCYKKGEFRELANYLTKSPETEKRLKEASYSTSKNMPLPKPKRSVVTRWETFGEKVRVPKGFYLDKESYHEGINPVTGYKYREYTLLRIKEKEEAVETSRRVHRDHHPGTGKRNRAGGVRDEVPPA